MRFYGLCGILGHQGGGRRLRHLLELELLARCSGRCHQLLLLLHLVVWWQLLLLLLLCGMRLRLLLLLLCGLMTCRWLWLLLWHCHYHCHWLLVGQVRGVWNLVKVRGLLDARWTLNGLGW